MSGGDWDSHFDVLHQMADAYEAVREREAERKLRDAMLYRPPVQEPRGPRLPALAEHRLPNGRVLIEPTGLDVVEGTYRAAAWWDHFGGWEIGSCSCTEEMPG